MVRLVRWDGMNPWTNHRDLNRRVVREFPRNAGALVFGNFPEKISRNSGLGIRNYSTLPRFMLQGRMMNGMGCDSLDSSYIVIAAI